jgi:hypothetical protein
MTVIKRYRSVAKLEFFTNAQRLRRNIFLLTARDFGIKKTVRTVEMLTEGMTDEDKTALKALAEKYGLARFNAEYPEWILEKFRNSLWDLTRDLLMNLTQANSIYALNTYEAQERRLLQDKAIGNCELIKAGIIEPEILENQFKSWIGDKSFYHAYHSLKNLTNYYKEQLHYVIRYRR